MFKESEHELKLKEECGVFGIYDPKGEMDLPYETYRALFSLQHRGQESCGIAVNVDGVLSSTAGMGLVSDFFDERTLNSIPKSAKMASGHVRYATSGQRTLANAQPMIVHHFKGALSLAHNGNLTNADKLRRELEMKGSIFHGTSDTEIITHIITQNRINSPNIETAVLKTMDAIEGAYCLVIMSATKLIAVRDPNGIRPLCFGQTDDGAWVVASESVALDTVGANLIRDVKPGEIIIFDINGMRTIEDKCETAPHKLCVFEYMYFARPDSVIEKTCVHEARVEAGRILAKSHPVEADVVIGAPDSGVDAAQGYAQMSGIPFEAGIVKNKYVGRSFIQGSQTERANTVRIKLNPIPSSIAGKRVVLVDDSIVRGTTSKRLIELLRRAGAKEVHFRVSSPPFRHPCYFGTDVADVDQLIANGRTEDDICGELGCDTLGYLSVEESKRIALNTDCDYCMGCFTGKYPVPVEGKPRTVPYARPLSESGTGKTL